MRPAACRLASARCTADVLCPPPALCSCHDSLLRAGHDRDNITFPGVQEQLISSVCAASKGPCIVVVMGGGSLDLTNQVADANVAAILWTGYPGEAGGIAIARECSPTSGRMVLRHHFTHAQWLLVVMPQAVCVCVCARVCLLQRRCSA